LYNRDEISVICELLAMKHGDLELDYVLVVDVSVELLRTA